MASGKACLRLVRSRAAVKQGLSALAQISQTQYRPRPYEEVPRRQRSSRRRRGVGVRDVTAMLSPRVIRQPSAAAPLPGRKRRIRKTVLAAKEREAPVALHGCPVDVSKSGEVESGDPSMFIACLPHRHRTWNVFPGYPAPPPAQPCAVCPVSVPCVVDEQGWAAERRKPPCLRIRRRR